METRAPRASISLYAGRTLEFVSVGDTWFELSADDDTLVARLRPLAPGLEGQAEAVDGRWWLVNPRGSELDAGQDGSGTTLARYRPGLLGGGRISIEDDGRYSLRPPVLGDSVRLRRGRRMVATIKGIRDVTVGEVESSLPILVALQALLLEQVMPHVGGGAGGP